MIHAGIIAAGLGERLQGAGVPKPLVPVGGKPLVHWTVDGLKRAGVRSITILLNTKGREVRRSLETAFPEIDWRFLVWDSPSSWQSFRTVAAESAKRADRFMISTVDALMRPDDVAAFSRKALATGIDASLAVTSFVDDEKPLWVDVDAAGSVKGVGEDAKERRFVTCGLYAVTGPTALRLAAREFSKLRDYWTTLVREGARVTAVDFKKTIDVDRPEDVAAAEAFLRETTCH